LYFQLLLVTIGAVTAFKEILSLNEKLVIFMRLTFFFIVLWFKVRAHAG
jgi:hypothetical protein